MVHRKPLDGQKLSIAGNLLRQGHGCELKVNGTQLLSGSYRTGGDVLITPMQGDTPRTVPGGPYLVHPVIFNPLSTDVSVSEAQVELRDMDGNLLDLGPLSNPFPQAISANIPSGGRGIAQIEAFTRAYGNGDRVTAIITLKGQTTDGQEVSSNPWYWTVSYCSEKCLYTCGPAEDPFQPSCTPGQDGVSAVYNIGDNECMR